MSQPSFPDTLLPENQQTVIHPIYFEQLNGDLIRSASLKTQGGAGPSAIDASGWRRLCTSFQSASTDLGNALAAFGKRLCTEEVDQFCLRAYVACRLIPLARSQVSAPLEYVKCQGES